MVSIGLVGDRVGVGVGCRDSLSSPGMASVVERTQMINESALGRESSEKQTETQRVVVGVFSP